MKTAMGMSFISMLSMEIAMNTTDYVLTGGAILNWWDCSYNAFALVFDTMALQLLFWRLKNLIRP